MDTKMKKKFEKDTNIIIQHFNKTIKKYKHGPKAVSWGSKQSQKIRFEILSEVGELKNRSVLDLGCGFGDFYGYLTKKRKIRLKKYLGIDIHPEMIKRAREKYPEAKFEVRDLLFKAPSKQSFDYVVESGIFNLKIPNWHKFTYKTLAKMYKISKIGVGANFLNIFSPFEKDRNSYYADPCKILKFVCTYLTHKIILRQNYKPNDFTIFFYKK